MKESGGQSSKRGSVIISYHIEAVAISASQPPDQQHFSGPLAEALSLTPPSLRHNTSPFGLLILATLPAISLNLTPHLHHSLIRSIQSYLNSLASSRVHYIQQRWMSRNFGSIEGVIYFFNPYELTVLPPKGRAEFSST